MLPGQLSHNAHLRGRASSSQSSNIINMSQTRDVCLTFEGNRLLLLLVMYPDGALDSSHQLLRLSYSPLSSSLQFCLSSLCPHPSVSLSFPFLHHFLAPLSGSWDLLVPGVILGVVSGVQVDRVQLQRGLPLPSLCSTQVVVIQASSISWPHSTSLVVISELFLT
jgi:hypothetical protein